MTQVSVTEMSNLYTDDLKIIYGNLTTRDYSIGIAKGPGVYLTLNSLEKAREVSAALNAAYVFGVSDERTRQINSSSSVKP